MRKKQATRFFHIRSGYRRILWSSGTSSEEAFLKLQNCERVANLPLSEPRASEYRRCPWRANCWTSRPWGNSPRAICCFRPSPSPLEPTDYRGCSLPHICAETEIKFISIPVFISGQSVCPTHLNSPRPQSIVSRAQNRRTLILWVATVCPYLRKFKERLCGRNWEDIYPIIATLLLEFASSKEGFKSHQ